MSSKDFKNWLTGQVDTLDPGTKLPTDKELSVKFGISRTTIFRTCQPMVKRGKLERIPGKGTFLPGKKALKLSKPSLSSSEVIADAIVRSITSGDLKIGEALPPIKFMSLRFKAAYKTIITAYQDLQQQGHITKVGKTFWVGKLKDLVHQKLKKEIYLFSFKSSDYSELFNQDLLAPAYQKMEKELLSHGFMVRYANTDDLEPLTADWIKTGKYPYGLVFCSMRQEDFEDYRLILIKTINQLDEWCPPILFDWHTGRYREKIKNVRLFVRGNILTSSARTLARYLLQHKYRKAIIYIDEEEPHWGFIGVSFTIFRAIWELYAMDRDFQVRIVIKPTNMSDRHLEFLRDRRIIGQLFVHNMELHAEMDMQYGHNIAEKAVMSGDLIQHFKECLDSPMWIFTNTGHAAQAYKWLTEHNTSIPEQVSLISLENDPKYFHLGLSYCGPDWDGIGYQLAHAVIGDIPVEKTSSGFIRSKASMIEKLTTK